MKFGAATILFFALLLSAYSGVRLPVEESEKLNREMKEGLDVYIQEKLKGCDSIVVRVAKLRPLLEGVPDFAVINDAKIISALVAALKAKQLEEHWITEEGIEGAVLPLVNCQCFGDFEFTFIKGSEALASVTISHWKNIRSEVLTGGTDAPLESDSIEQLYDLAGSALPGYRIKKPVQAALPMSDVSVQPGS